MIVAASMLSLFALADLNGTVVFSNKLGGVANYRIPAVVQTVGTGAKSPAIVAFAEARDGGDSSASRIAVRSSTDAGRSWSPVVFAAGSAVKSATCTKANITSCRSGNPAAVYDSTTDEIVLLYVARGFGAGEDPVGNGMVKSSDGGLTWTAPIDVSDGFGAASGSMPGPGTALQLSAAGPHKGRLLVASHHGAYQHDYVTVSDDNGGSWKTIPQTFPKMDEAALTELPDGEVLLNMRHGDSPKQGRGTARSTDGGNTFGPIEFDKTLISPVCQASIVSFDNATYFSNPASTKGRNHLTIRKSIDNAQTWTSELLVQAGSSAGYSCLVKGAIQKGNSHAQQREPALASLEDNNSGEGGILYEAVGGTIDFAIFPLSLSYE